MPNVKIKALDQFSHGRLVARPGGEYVVNDVDANDLAKAGLAEVMGDATDEESAELSDGKMEPMTMNKMEKAAANKAEKK